MVKNIWYFMVINGFILVIVPMTLLSQYEDKTGLGLYSHLNNKDPQRRTSYLARAKGIKDKQGNLTYLDKNSPNHYSVKYLW